MNEARRFTHLSRAWFGDTYLWNLPDVDDEITIGMYDEDGGTTGEFCIKWTVLDGGPAVPVLMASYDAWKALFAFRDFLERLAEVDGQNITPDDVCKILAALGIEDATPTDGPT